MLQRRWSRAALVVVVVVSIVGVLLALQGPSLTPAERAAIARLRLENKELRLAKRADRAITVSLPRRAGLEPLATGRIYQEALPSHEVVGFAPWWELSAVSAADLVGSSDICYFGLSVKDNGTLAKNDLGYKDLAKAAPLVASAHSDGDGALLVLESSDNSTIDHLIGHPKATAAVLAATSVPLVRAGGYQGVDLDLEGTNPRDRKGFVAFVAAFTSDLKRVDPALLVMLDTYAGSAGNSNDFFDVKALAPLVNQIFVMAYDMGSSRQAGSNDPLVTSDLAPSDVQSLLQYQKVVPKDKIVLGMPFYGYDFSTKNDTVDSPLVAHPPEAVTYSSVLSAGHHAHWDPIARSPYAVFKNKRSWQVTYYDDALSLSIRTALASQFHVAGVGAWALGMDGSSPSLIAALDGGSQVAKPFSGS